MTIALTMTIVAIGTALTMVVTRHRIVKAPPVVALFGIVMISGIATAYAYKHNADEADQRACEQRVASRDDLRGQFSNFYNILLAGFDDNEFVIALVEKAKSDMDRPPEEGGYPALDPEGCEQAPYIAYPVGS